SRRTTYTGGPRSYSCRRKSWSDELGGADRPFVPVLVGPTGVGKTAVAVAWGKREAILAISADARQVYRCLDIGTAKPDRAQRAGVPHLGIDLIDPGERYSAGQFARDASVWLAGVWAAGRQPVVVGGTGFYVRALAEGLFREPPLDAAARRPARGSHARRGTGGGSARGAGGGRRAPRAGSGRRGIPGSRGDARRQAPPARVARRDRARDATVREAAGDVVQKPTARPGRREAGDATRVDPGRD